MALEIFNQIGGEITSYKKLCELNEESIYKVLAARFTVTQFGKRVVATIAEALVEYPEHFEVYFPKRFEKVKEEELSVLVNTYMSVRILTPGVSSSVKLYFRKEQQVRDQQIREQQLRDQHLREQLRELREQQLREEQLLREPQKKKIKKNLFSEIGSDTVFVDDSD